MVNNIQYSILKYSDNTLVAIECSVSIPCQIQSCWWDTCIQSTQTHTIRMWPCTHTHTHTHTHTRTHVIKIITTLPAQVACAHLSAGVARAFKHVSKASQSTRSTSACCRGFSHLPDLMSWGKPAAAGNHPFSVSHMSHRNNARLITAPVYFI